MLTLFLKSESTSSQTFPPTQISTTMDSEGIPRSSVASETFKSVPTSKSESRSVTATASGSASEMSLQAQDTNATPDASDSTTPSTILYATDLTTALPVSTDAASRSKQNNDGDAENAQRDRNWLFVVVPLAIVIPAFVAALTVLWRQYALRRRKGMILRWSRERGLRYSMDFECRGQMIQSDTDVKASANERMSQAYPVREARNSVPRSEFSTPSSFADTPQIGRAF